MSTWHVYLQVWKRSNIIQAASVSTASGAAYRPSAVESGCDGAAATSSAWLQIGNWKAGSVKKKLKNNEKHVVSSEETKLGPGAWGVPSTSSMESISCKALLKKRYTEQRRHGKPCKPCSKPCCESKPEACWLILQVVCFYWHLSTVLTSCECFLEVLNSESINPSFYLHHLSVQTIESAGSSFCFPPPVKAIQNVQIHDVVHI